MYMYMYFFDIIDWIHVDDDDDDHAYNSSVYTFFTSARQKNVSKRMNKWKKKEGKKRNTNSLTKILNV